MLVYQRVYDWPIPNNNTISGSNCNLLTPLAWQGLRCRLIVPCTPRHFFPGQGLPGTKSRFQQKLGLIQSWDWSKPQWGYDRRARLVSTIHSFWSRTFRRSSLSCICQLWAFEELPFSWVPVNLTTFHVSLQGIFFRRFFQNEKAPLVPKKNTCQT